MVFMKRKESFVEILHHEQKKKDSNIIKFFGSDPTRQQRCKKRNRKNQYQGVVKKELFHLNR